MNKKIFLVSIFLLCIITSCKSQETKPETKNIEETLLNRPLPEIKQVVNGEWELVSNQNEREIGEFENTFITFDGDNYVWTENGNSEKGKLNWRKTSIETGDEAYLMDVFYEDFPAFPLAIKGDTLYIQDCSETKYKYTLIRKKK